MMAQGASEVDKSPKFHIIIAVRSLQDAKVTKFCYHNLDCPTLANLVKRFNVS